MTVEQAVRTKLLATVGVTSLVNQRVWTQILPQDPTLPAVRLQVIDEVPRAHLRGINDLVPTRLQVDVFTGKNSSDPYGTANTVMDAVTDALTPTPFSATGTGSPAEVVDVVHAMPQGRQPLYIAEEKLQVRIQQDFIVWSKPAN